MTKSKAQKYEEIFDDNAECITGSNYCLSCGVMMLYKKDEVDQHKARGHNVQQFEMISKRSIFKMFDRIKEL